MICWYLASAVIMVIQVCMCRNKPSFPKMVIYNTIAMWLRTWHECIFGAWDKHVVFVELCYKDRFCRRSSIKVKISTLVMENVINKPPTMSSVRESSYMWDTETVVSWNIPKSINLHKNRLLSCLFIPRTHPAEEEWADAIVPVPKAACTWNTTGHKDRAPKVMLSLTPPIHEPSQGAQRELTLWSAGQHALSYCSHQVLKTSPMSSVATLTG